MASSNTNLQEKAAKVDQLRERFAAAPLVVLTDFKGVTVKQIDRVRRGCEAVGVRFQVAKNTLCVRAIQGSEKEKLSSYFSGSTGVIFSSQDPIATAKLLKGQLKENEKLIVRAAFFEGDILDQKGVVAVSDLPSREQLLSNLLGTLQEGPRQLLGILQAPGRDVLGVLSNYASKLEGGS